MCSVNPFTDFSSSFRLCARSNSCTLETAQTREKLPHGKLSRRRETTDGHAPMP
jgi:hypothetical protein